MIQSANINKKPYAPDLVGFLTQCELNYWLVTRLCEESDVLAPSNIVVNHTWQFEANSVVLSFLVTEMAPYTTTLRLNILLWPFAENQHEQSLSQKNQAYSNKNIELIIRLYHDAKLLEVMEGSGPSTLRAIHLSEVFPEKPVDEKRQINLFVGECLRTCLKAVCSSDGIV